jgi:hypothetical protein
MSYLLHLVGLKLNILIILQCIFFEASLLNNLLMIKVIFQKVLYIDNLFRQYFWTIFLKPS